MAESADRMPYEGSGQTVDEAAAGLFEDLGSDPDFSEEEHPEVPEPEAEPDDEVEEAAEPDEAEDVDDDAEAEDEESDEDEGTDDSEEESEDQTIEVNGERITLEELKKGYLRQSDYTRKRQEEAEIAKKRDAEAAAYRETREQYGQRLEVLEKVLESTTPTEPDWDTLRRENPAEYAAQRADWDRLQAVKQQAAAERQRIAQEQATEHQQRLAEIVQTEAQRLHEAIPEWKDESTAAAEKRKLIEYANGTYGYTQEELGQVFDHRLILMLRKAQKYDELTTKGAEKIREKQKASPTLKPGGRTPNPGRKSAKAEKRAMSEKLARSGSVRDAAEYFEKFLLDD